METEHFYDEFETLKAAIEAAIEKALKNRPEAISALNDVPKPSLISNRDFDLNCANGSSGVVGWVDDF